MRNIAEIIKDDRNGKQLSQTERQIVTAYIQGKYDAVRELKIGNNSNINKVLDKLKAEISKSKTEHEMQIAENNIKAKLLISDIYCDIVNIIDRNRG